eukprot:6210360-Pleurochrysis_carterae.AAC.3
MHDRQSRDGEIRERKCGAMGRRPEQSVDAARPIHASVSENSVATGPPICFCEEKNSPLREVEASSESHENRDRKCVGDAGLGRNSDDEKR